MRPTPGPVIIMIRHASIIDNMLPDSLVARTHGIGLRYVIKRELQVIPTIDIGGRWVPTNFVRRGSGDSEAEINRLLRLTEDLGEGEGILIYPEGTRFTPAKLERAQEIVRERQPEVAPLADRLQHLLPPRLGGPLALLEEVAGRGRRLLRPRRLRRLSVHLRRLGRAARRLGHRRQVLACAGGGDSQPTRTAAPDGSMASGRRWTTGSSRRSTTRMQSLAAPTRNESERASWVGEAV